ncbi:polysaccharide biosynthesis tyrosine autokinase [Bacteroidota bacterium]
METPQQPYSNQYPPAYLPDTRPVNWRKYLYLFLTNWYWFLITIFIALSIAYLKNRYTLPNYRATATLLIEEEGGTSDLLGEIKSVQKRRRNTDLSNEVSKLKAFSLHRRTIDSLGWDVFWTGHGRVAMERPIYYFPPFSIETDTSSSSWFSNQVLFIDRQDKQSIRIYNKNGIDTILLLNQWNNISEWKFRISENKFSTNYASYSFIIYDPNTLTKRFMSKVSYDASEQRGTVITISSQGSVVDREIEYINTLCENYINTGLERKRLIANNSLEFIESQISIIQDSLRRTEQQLLTFRLNKNVIDLSKEGEQAYSKLQQFYNNKTQLKLKRNYYEYVKKYIENKRDPLAIIAPILAEANDQMFVDQVQNLQELYEQRELLSFAAVPENPGLIQVNSRIEAARLKLMEIIDALISNNELAWQQIDIEEKEIENQLLKLPVSEQELLNIQRKYDVINQFYTFLLEKRAEAGIQRASTVSNVRILDKALPYTTSTTGTKKSVIFLTALLLGLLLPGGIIVLADALDSRIKDRRDIEDNTDLPILGVVAHNNTEDQIPVHASPGSAFAESFRHLRTNLQYILREPEQKVIMITSTISGEGKTFIALNLSAILAMNNKKVLVAGFDLRRPSLHKVFNIDNKNGISNYLAGICEIKDIIHHTNIDGLDVMIAGPTPPNPAELIETRRMKELINESLKNYDYIIIDTPPVALVTDALLISKYSNANIFVVRQNYSHTGEFELINNLSDKKLSEISLLVNDIREARPLGYRYYYGYGFGYGYSYNYQYRYGYKYYQDDKKD